jgi:hypothetical protein
VDLGGIPGHQKGARLLGAEEHAKATPLLASRHAGRWHLDGGSDFLSRVSAYVQSNAGGTQKSGAWIHDHPDRNVSHKA